MKKDNSSRVTRYMAAALALGVLLAACSGEAPAPTQTTVPTAAATPAQAALPTQTAPALRPTATPTVVISQGGPAREIEVLLNDNTFPKMMDFTVGETVRLIITNNGSVEHIFEFTDFDILWEIDLEETETFEWTVPNEPGEYDCGCYLSGEDPAAHEKMEGICNILRP